MQSHDKRKPIIIILGPTAVGKTEISLELANSFDGEIVSCDSRLFYRGMDIGTAKPSMVDRARVPHHLIDIVNPDQILSLAMFLDAAHKSIDDIHNRGKLPFLVGGSGQYVRAIVENWQIPKVQPNPRLRLVLESWAEEIGPEGLYTRLLSIDRAAANRMDSLNTRRIVRALEVILSTGRLFSSQKRRGDSLYRVIQLGLTRPRAELYARVDARIDDMFSQGLLEETKRLLEMGYSPELSSLSAIGYRQVIAFLEGKIEMDEAILQMKRITHRFVRHQANWFKIDDPAIRWFQAAPNTVEAIKKTIFQLV